LDRVGGSPGGCHPRGGQALVVIAGNQRLVLALLARRVRRAAGGSCAVAMAGAWLVRVGRTLPGAGLIVGRAGARRFDRSGGAAARRSQQGRRPGGVYRVIQAQGSADTTADGCSELWVTGQPGSSRIWRGFGGATR